MPTIILPVVDEESMAGILSSNLNILAAATLPLL